MRICMLAYTFYDTDNRVMRYAEALVKRGDQVDVIALKRPGDRFHDVISGVQLYRIQKRIFNEKSKFSYLYRLLKFFFLSSIFLIRKHFENPYDIVHVHSVPDFEIFAAILPKLMGAKIILDIHDIVPEFYVSKFNTRRNGLFYMLLILTEKLSIAFANHVIISNHIWLKRLTGRSVKDKKCTVIMNFPDESIFYRRNRSKTDDKFIIVYPGTLNWHQGVDIAVKAFAIIKDDAPNAFFYIYGEGPSRDLLLKLIMKLELEQRVILQDPLPIKDIAKIMTQADLGIVPKRNDPFGGEAFSTKIFEFMILGVPIVVSKTKIDQYYFNESIVKFFNPDDEKDLAEAILLLINNRDLREMQAKNAIKFMKNNNWSANKHIYYNILESYAGSKDNWNKTVK